MSRLDNEIRVSWSVLDRLIDNDPNESQDPPKSQSASLTELKQAVRRDLEWLLNTRCHMENIDGALEESPSSVAFYGLPDFTSVSAKRPEDLARADKQHRSNPEVSHRGGPGSRSDPRGGRIRYRAAARQREFCCKRLAGLFAAGTGCFSIHSFSQQLCEIAVNSRVSLSLCVTSF
jgi:hypothetical protein